MLKKRDLLSQLSRTELLAAVAQYDLAVDDRRNRTQLLEALACSKRAKLQEILSGLSRDRLKELCRAFGHDDTGREKAAIIERLTGSSKSRVAVAKQPKSSKRPVPTQTSASSKRSTKVKSTVSRTTGRSPRTATPSASGKHRMKNTAASPAPHFEQTFKNLDNILRKEAGCSSELDYTEQTSWMLFLKYLDDLEQERAMEAELRGQSYEYILDANHRWSQWAVPKKADGSVDRDHARIGDDLITYIHTELFPYLRGFKQRATSPDTIEYKIGEIFGEITPKFRSGYTLRDALELVDALQFRSQQEKHELSSLYEDRIKRMGNAGRNGGEYYTPRPLIRAMIQVTKPKIGEKIYDGAAGSAGFLCEAYEYLRQNTDLSTNRLKTLQSKTFYGKEKKSLAYVIGIMNMILHGIEAPNIVHTNTLSENILDIQEKDRFDVILTNPPFGGTERAEVQQNFPIKSSETAFLFLQHFIRSLKAGGRAAVVIKNTFLSNADNASRALRQELLESANLHTVLDCPGGTFQGAGVKTVVLFFEKGSPTRKIWYYQLNPGRNLGKTNPLNDDDLKEFVVLQAKFSKSDQSWAVDVKDVDQETFDLSVKNPNKEEEAPLREPAEILAEIAALDAQSAKILAGIRGML